MTALAFLRLGSRSLLLAGEGPLLRVYSQETNQLLLSERLFKSQSLHGVSTQSICEYNRKQKLCAKVLAWGGRYLCLLAVEHVVNGGTQGQVQIRQLLRGIQADDWIFDACLSPATTNDLVPISTSRVCEAVLVTAHNALLALSLQTRSDDDAETLPIIDCIAAGPRSILYSAHVTWPEHGRGLVAAGTVFGEVLLWSFSTDLSFFGSEKVVSGHLHYTFSGHEGSVFGVQISKEAATSDAGFPRRILASCSDDRTIKIWNISGVEFNEADSQTQDFSRKPRLEHFGNSIQRYGDSCLATAMGHSSRIWGVRFLYRQRDIWNLSSYGEDGTAQVWQLRVKPSTPQQSKEFDFQAMHLTHQFTYTHHTGKNIWSMATYTTSQSGAMISTGGADGQIVSYSVKSHISSGNSSSWSSQYSIQEALERANAPTKHDDICMNSSVATKRWSPTERDLFQGLQGKWRLRRNLKSAIPTYPSGLYEGIAVFETRNPTDEAYDLEYLYIENGKFTTEQGVDMQATRRYVYRFQEKTNTISAWFVCTRDQSVVDYLFHEVSLESQSSDLNPEEGHGMTAMRAKGHHLCIDDDYQASYKFQLKGAALTRWNLAYVVKGPKKDYIADARYIRESSLEQSTSSAEYAKPNNEGPEGSNNPIDPTRTRNIQNSFKNYAWIDDDCFITSTEHGDILSGPLFRSTQCFDEIGCKEDDPPTILWKTIGQVNQLRSYCVITNASVGRLAVLGGSEGNVYTYQDPGHINHVVKLTRKVTHVSTQLLSPSSCFLPEEQERVSPVLAVFVSCLGTSTAHFLVIGVSENEKDDVQGLTRSGTNTTIFQDILIDLPPHFVPTSALLIDSWGLLVLGSRSGRLSFYDLLDDADSRGTCKYLSENVHGNGEDLITAVENVPCANLARYAKNLYVLTTGRDGNYSVHQIFMNKMGSDETHLGLQTIHRCAPPFGPNIEGARFVENTNDLLLWGFRSKHFVVWNETQKIEVMNIDCGGTNRNWAYTPQNDGSGGGSFVWTKASICNIHSQVRSSHQVLQHGGHGREIKTMAISPRIIGENGYSSKFIATGAEDTAIRIFGHDLEGAERTAQGFKCLGVFTNHRTGIQQLKWSTDGKYLFSAAGFEEFFIWRVRSMPCIGIGVVCEARFPPVTESSDLRIMDFDILEIESEESDEYILSLVYSDSSLRVRTQP